VVDHREHRYNIADPVVPLRQSCGRGAGVKRTQSGELCDMAESIDDGEYVFCEEIK
jgi:hypothetical protein